MGEFGGGGEGLVFEMRRYVVLLTFEVDYLFTISLKVCVVGSRLWMKAAGKPYRTGPGKEKC